jgi:hypothetical protein
MVIIPGVDVDEGRLADICNRYGIAELKIFGSQTRGTAGPTSDIASKRNLGRAASIRGFVAAAGPTRGGLTSGAA